MYNFYVKTEQICNKIDELLLKLENDNFKNKLIKKMAIKTGNISPQLHKLVAFYLSENYSKGNISESTIYRIIKIKEKNGSVYDQVKSGEISVKAAYNILYYGSKVAKPKLINLKSLYSQMVEVNKKLEGDDMLYKYSLEQLKMFDEEIFKFRKSIGRRIVKRDINH